MQYIVSLGSNIKPARHMPEVLTKMLGRFDKLVVSRFFRTKAFAMTSRHQFWNGAVLIETCMSCAELKGILNRWEEESGRDRSHPHCSVRDRTLDLDILWSEKLAWLDDVQALKQLPYVWQPVSSLLLVRDHALHKQQTVWFKMQGGLVGGRRQVLKGARKRHALRRC